MVRSQLVTRAKVAPPVVKAAPTPAADSIGKSELMTNISAKMSESAAPVPEQQAPNTTRICDMMYAELMNIPDVRAREQLQYQLHSVIMQYNYPEMFAAASHSTQFMPQTTFPVHHPQPELQSITFSGFHSPASASTFPSGDFTPSIFTRQSHQSSEASSFACRHFKSHR